MLGLGVYKGDDPTQQGSGLAWPHHQLERQDRAGEQQSGSMRDRKGTWAGRIKKLKSKLDSFSRQRFRCQWQEDHGEGPAEHMAASSFHPPRRRNRPEKPRQIAAHGARPRQAWPTRQKRRTKQKGRSGTQPLIPTGPSFYIAFFLLIPNRDALSPTILGVGVFVTPSPFTPLQAQAE